MLNGAWVSRNSARIVGLSAAVRFRLHFPLDEPQPLHIQITAAEHQPVALEIDRGDDDAMFCIRRPAQFHTNATDSKSSSQPSSAHTYAIWRRNGTTCPCDAVGWRLIPDSKERNRS